MMKNDFQSKLDQATELFTSANKDIMKAYNDNIKIVEKENPEQAALLKSLYKMANSKRPDLEYIKDQIKAMQK